MTAIRVYVTGGGGGGGGIDGQGTNTAGGGGGGGGGTAIKFITSGIGATETVTVGAAALLGQALAAMAVLVAHHRLALIAARLVARVVLVAMLLCRQMQLSDAAALV